MDQSEGWGRSRYVTLIVVIGVHVGLVAALMMASRAQIGALSTEQPVELLLFPPTTAPKVRPESFRPKRLSGDTAITMAPPGSIQSRPPRHQTPLRQTATAREWIGRRKGAAPCKPTKFATACRRATTHCRARRRKRRGGRRRTAVPVCRSRRPAAIGSSGSIQTATKWPPPTRTRTRSARCCHTRSANRATLRPRKRRGIPLPIRIGELAEDLSERKSPARADHGEVLVVHIDADMSGELEFVAPDDGEVERRTA